MSVRLSVYDFHGQRLGCRADAAVSAALASRLGRFPVSDGGDACDMCFEYASLPGDSLASAVEAAA